MKISDVIKAKLPDTPGVYFFRLGDEILYIGKATSLRDRTKSYFAKDLIATRGPLIVDMVFKADNITFEETDSVLEALILEANLIKKYQPYYNTKEKDDKSWNYVCITKGDCPMVLVERGKNINFETGTTLNGVALSDWYGPFTSGTQLKEALKIIRRIFPFVDASSAKRDNYEFYRQLGLTPDVSGEEKLTAYKRSVRNLKLFFEGKKKTIVSELERDMKLAAKEERFEDASHIRNQLFALGHINDIALLKGDPSVRKEKAGFRIEAYDVAHMSGKNMVGVMTVMEDGEVNKKEYRTFTVRGFTKANDTGALEEILSRRLRHTEWGMPDLVVADGGEAQLRVARQVLDRYQMKVPVVSVVKDDHHKPKDFLGDMDMVAKHKKEILLMNSEAHRFSIRLHKNKRDKNFLP
ncbi:MAG: UvrB/UvrC motif-containing protein [bacterium]